MLACPAGETPVSCTCQKERYRVAFAATTCQACPLNPCCPVKPGKIYHYLYYAEKAGRAAARRAYQQTAEFRERYRWRAGR